MSDHIQIGDTSPRVQHVGDGTQTVFTYPFPIFKDADLEVYVDSTLSTLSTDYAVTGAGASSGGEITFVSAPADQSAVTLVRRLTIQRTSDFQASGEFRAKVINDELDFQTASLQQIEDDLSRAIRLKRDDAAATLELPLAATRANKLIGFDASGNAELSNLTLTEIETGASGPTGPTGPTGPQGADGMFSGSESAVAPALDDLLALKDVSDADAAKFATVQNLFAAINLLTDDGANVSMDTDWLVYFDTNTASVKKMNPSDISGRLVRVNVRTTSGSFTKQSATNSLEVIVVGGGGGGAKNGSGTSRSAGGGGGGGVSTEIIDVSGGASGVTVTIGAAGAGATGAGSGGDGGTSSFGAFCSATGGTGGSNEAAGGNGGAGGIGSGSASGLNLPGQGGGSMGQTGDNSGGGGGGSSWISGGARSQGAASTAAGEDARGYGAGGGGGNGTADGGDGAPGVIIIKEYS